MDCAKRLLIDLVDDWLAEATWLQVHRQFIDDVLIKNGDVQQAVEKQPEGCKA